MNQASANGGVRSLCGSLLLSLVALCVFDSGVFAAGLVITPQSRLAGDLTLKQGSLHAAGTAVVWDDVVVAINDGATVQHPAANTLELKNGEVWAGQINGVRNGVAVMESPMLGKCTVKIDDVRSLNFQPGLPVVVEPQTNMLHRLRGKPSPGALLWVDADRLAAETALGAVSFERDKVERYVVDSGPVVSNAVAEAYDAVALTDGSILHGVVRVDGESLVLNHAVAGEKRIADVEWIWLRRHSPVLRHLADAAPASVQTFPLIRRPADPPRVQYGPETGAAVDAPSFLRRVHISPRTVMSYRLGDRAGEFRCVVSLEERSRGPASVWFRVGEKTVFEQVLKPENTVPVPVAFAFEKDTELVVEADFGEVVRFPCGVAMDDPFMVLAK